MGLIEKIIDRKTSQDRAPQQTVALGWRHERRISDWRDWHRCSVDEQAQTCVVDSHRD